MGLCVSRGFSGDQPRAARTVTHNGIKGPAKFGNEAGVGYDGDFEGAIETKVVVGELKAVEAAPAKKVVLPNVRNTFVAKLDNGDDANSSPHIVDARRSSQSTADFEASYKNAGAAPKKIGC